jgi:hypothetical protein
LLLESQSASRRGLYRIVAIGVAMGVAVGVSVSVSEGSIQGCCYRCCYGCCCWSLSQRLGRDLSRAEHLTLSAARWFLEPLLLLLLLDQGTPVRSAPSLNPVRSALVPSERVGRAVQQNAPAARSFSLSRNCAQRAHPHALTLASAVTSCEDVHGPGWRSQEFSHGEKDGGE